MLVVPEKQWSAGEAPGRYPSASCRLVPLTQLVHQTVTGHVVSIAEC